MVPNLDMDFMSNALHGAGLLCVCVCACARVRVRVRVRVRRWLI